MTIDLSQFPTTFYEESFEGLDVMESELLNLDTEAVDLEIINTIFRAAHSIKGGGGTFGLSSVASFTHEMETFLDEVRNGQRQVTLEAVNILLHAVDVLRDMLTALRDDAKLDDQRIADAQKDLDRLMGSSPEEGSSDNTEQKITPNNCEGWTIVIRPHAELFKTGNDPVRMFQELGNLGKLTVDVDISALPTFAEMDPEQSYLSWTLVLKGNVTQESVQEIFEWVEDECDLDISPILGAPTPAALSDLEESDTNSHK